MIELTKSENTTRGANAVVLYVSRISTSSHCAGCRDRHRLSIRGFLPFAFDDEAQSPILGLPVFEASIRSWPPRQLYLQTCTDFDLLPADRTICDTRTGPETQPRRDFHTWTAIMLSSPCLFPIPLSARNGVFSVCHPMPLRLFV